MDDRKTRRKVWIIGNLVLIVLGMSTASAVVGGLWVLWFMFGGIVLIVKGAMDQRDEEEARGVPIDYPWVIRPVGIIILGFFTMGLHWIVGPILRAYYRKGM